MYLLPANESKPVQCRSYQRILALSDAERLPINFPWINLTAELGVLLYFLRLSLAHLPSGRAGTSGWHQTVIFPSSSNGGLYLLLLGCPLALPHPGGFCKSACGSGRCLYSDGGVWGSCPKYQSNLVRVWKTDDTLRPSRACGCRSWEPQAHF